jgi:hypothetical protein
LNKRTREIVQKLSKLESKSATNTEFRGVAVWT